VANEDCARVEENTTAHSRTEWSVAQGNHVRAQREKEAASRKSGEAYIDRAETRHDLKVVA
jgi:hypothetical protein